MSAAADPTSDTRVIATPSTLALDREVGAAEFRSAMAEVCTPVAVVTAALENRPHGTTVSAFTSLSVTPPMVLVSLDRASDLLAMITTTGTFGLNVLGAAADADALAFARKGADKFADSRWEWDRGLPRLAGATAWLTCSVTDLLSGGDHVIITATVLSADVNPLPPLVYHNRKFGTHSAFAVGSSS